MATKQKRPTAPKRDQRQRDTSDTRINFPIDRKLREAFKLQAMRNGKTIRQVLVEMAENYVRTARV